MKMLFQFYREFFAAIKSFLLFLHFLTNVPRNALLHAMTAMFGFCATVMSCRADVSVNVTQTARQPWE